MNIEKRFWKWDESLNTTQYRLRGDIGPLISAGRVLKRKEADEYTGIDNDPWVIVTNHGKIIQIFYNRKFPELMKENVWDFELERFEAKVSGILQPSFEGENCDKLQVVFRDYFVAIACIQAQKPEN